jgi:hypothetical protein
LLRRIQAARAVSKTTVWTVFRFQRREVMLMSLWVSLSYIVENISPLAMFKLLEHLSNPRGATYQPWLWLFLIFFGLFLFFAPNYLGHAINYDPADPLVRAGVERVAAHQQHVVVAETPHRPAVVEELGEDRPFVDSWSQRVASFRTADIVVVRRLEPAEGRQLHVV